MCLNDTRFCGELRAMSSGPNAAKTAFKVIAFKLVALKLNQPDLFTHIPGNDRAVGKSIFKRRTKMSQTVASIAEPKTEPVAAKLDMKLEVVVIPVSDIDRAKKFYAGLGWRFDADFRFVDGYRSIQFTPPSSGCSLHFGTIQPPASPRSAKGYLVVSDIVAARNALVARGIQVSEFFHVGEGGVSAGLDPERRSYRSRASFDDPDGNTWILQEVTARLPGLVDPGATSYGSVNDLAGAMRRASAAHEEYEKRLGHRDEDWPDWYAAYMVAEASGTLAGVSGTKLPK
jgi:catechol 2,3-dioxygenase-like lactoylglutathione lyase family enzyme